MHKRCEIQNTVIAVMIMALGFYIITVDSESESCLRFRLLFVHI